VICLPMYSELSDESQGEIMSLIIEATKYK
jgi:hypothetical protein